MIKIETKVLFQERVMVMALAQATKSHEPTYTINDAMDVLLSRLDEAIDDMESDRVQIVIALCGVSACTSSRQRILNKL